MLEANKDRIQGDNEAGIDGVTVKLINQDGNPVKDYSGNLVADQVTANGGKYEFTNLVAGEYRVVFVAPNDHEFSLLSVGTDREKDSDADPASSQSSLVALNWNENIQNVDAGLVEILPSPIPPTEDPAESPEKTE